MAARRLRGFARFVGALVVLGSAPGCTDDGVSLHVICPIFPEISDNACKYEPDSEACVAEGVMNVQSTDTYRLNLSVESGLKPRTRDVPPRGESSGIQLLSAKVELRFPSGDRINFDDPRVPNPYEVPAAGYIEPGGRAATSIVAIDPTHAARLKTNSVGFPPVIPQVVVALKLKGKTNGDTSVESGEYSWPIRLVSIDPRGTSCQAMDYCVQSFGQDGFASACAAQ